MTPEEFRSSAHQVVLADFLVSPTGEQLVQILKDSARPSVQSKAHHGTHDDVKFQMALNLVSSIERYQVIDEITKMSYPIKTKAVLPYSAIEEETDEAISREIQRSQAARKTKP